MKRSKPNTNFTPDEKAKQHLLKICDIFGHHPHKAEVNQCITSMFFIKYVSDYANSRYQYYSNLYPDKKPLVMEMLKHDRFIVPESANFYTLHKQRFFPENGERLDAAIEALEHHNRFKLIDGPFRIFKNTSFNTIKLGTPREKNNLLQLLLEIFHTPDLILFREQEISFTGKLFSSLIQYLYFDSKHKHDIDITPPSLSTLIVAIAAPKKGETICDPTCGLGNLLLLSAQEIQTHSATKDYALFGQELRENYWGLAKLNLLFNGEDNHILKWGDTLQQPHLLNEDESLIQFDLVICHPPFNPSNWREDNQHPDPHCRFPLGLPPKNKADYAFLLHTLSTLKAPTEVDSGGRSIIFLPHGVLFRGGIEGEIREQLVNLGYLDTIISIPDKLFRSGVSGVLMVVSKLKKEGILFIDASRMLKNQKKGSSFSQNHIDFVTDIYRKRESIENFSYVANIKEIQQNGYNLNIRRYVNIMDHKRNIDLEEVRLERNVLIDKLDHINNQMTLFLEDLDITK